MCRVAEDASKERTRCCWIIGALGTLTISAIGFAVGVGMHYRNNSDGGGGDNDGNGMVNNTDAGSVQMLMPTSVPTSLAPTTTSPTTVHPTVNPSMEPTAEPTTFITSVPTPLPPTNNDTSSTVTLTTSTAMPPLMITLIALAGASVLLCCLYAEYRRRQAAHFKHSFHYVVAEPPRSVVRESHAMDSKHDSVGTIDVAREQRQVDAIRARRAKPAVLEDLDEDDLGVTEVPIRPIHYGLSPSETLEGVEFHSQVEDANDNDDADATLVMH